ncbi:MAG: hypothetical protein WCT19_00600 [Candidatus Paceibacterota bacterium]
MNKSQKNQRRPAKNGWKSSLSAPTDGQALAAVVTGQGRGFYEEYVKLEGRALRNKYGQEPE